MNSRREFLTKLGVGALAVTGAAALTACRKGGGAVTCTDPAGTSNPTRTTLHYTDTTTKPDQRCDNCAQYVAGDGCGKCKIFGDSPVAPGGGCDIWAKKA